MGPRSSDPTPQDELFRNRLENRLTPVALMYIFCPATRQTPDTPCRKSLNWPAFIAAPVAGCSRRRRGDMSLLLDMAAVVYTLVCTQGIGTVYEWDDQKNQRNFAKHGLDFEDAEHVFSAPDHVTYRDERFACGEERFITMGPLAGRLVVIAHTPRGANTRIVSMRKANNREQKNYQKRLGKT